MFNKQTIVSTIQNASHLVAYSIADYESYNLIAYLTIHIHTDAYTDPMQTPHHVHTYTHIHTDVYTDPCTHTHTHTYTHVSLLSESFITSLLLVFH